MSNKMSHLVICMLVDEETEIGLSCTTRRYLSCKT